ncbi:trehalose-phosphatase [Niveispirillum sp. SYP-B3756]|uniref:trehalose-phosphatase n=1 Tax=Niveispirillum sp. SYP-B3756 TaxID=2662178 RepID=UPI00129231EA|nr:trehalose-phosphatase [Niveispirillum sp. SYP-B3756]
MMYPPSISPEAMCSVDAVLARIAGLERASSQPVALLLDYDGTLTPIVDRPDQAFLTPTMHDLLSHLAGLYPLAIVSGRDVEDVRRLVAIDNIIYVGSHGLDIATPDQVYQPGQPFRAAIQRAAARLENELASITNAFVQSKRYAITVHTRLVAPAAKPHVAAIVREVLTGEPSLRHMDGKEMHELRPVLDWHKGSAIGWLLGDLLAGHPPLFLGDDVTDEDGFRAVAGTGLGVRVGAPDQPTAADLHIPDVGAVEWLLQRLGERRLAATAG